jgi:hypothetical protein
MREVVVSAGPLKILKVMASKSVAPKLAKVCEEVVPLVFCAYHYRKLTIETGMVIGSCTLTDAMQIVTIARVAGKCQLLLRVSISKLL